MERIEIEKILKKELDKERFRHTMGVMYTAAALAMAHGCNMEQAMMAGLLHDCAKCVPNDKKLALCKKHHIAITKAEERSPFLLHAKLGAWAARKKFGIKDPDILHAIAVHTTGAPKMNLLDKIIYIADYMEPNRNKAPNLEQVRGMAFEDLDQTMLRILEDTLSYLEQGKGEIDPMTAEACTYFQALCNSQKACNKEETV